MKMERRHFQFIAETISTIGTDSTGWQHTRDQFARHFAASLAKTNPQFDRERFLKACNYEGVN